MINSIDLHIHSTASDGSMTPAELARHVKENGICAAALCDHDTTAGAAEFIGECTRLGIEGISGVEISAEYKCEMHILGLFVDYNSDELNSSLEALRLSRQTRNAEMIKRLNEYGFCISETDITSQKEGGTLLDTGRAHFASAMVKKGYVKDKNEAFLKYLGNGKPCYVPRFKLSAEKSISLIHNAGGLAVLAHPIYITADSQELIKLLTWLKSKGLDGAECYYSEYDRAYSVLCLEAVKTVGLFASGGSDFHGENKPDIPIGIVNGGERVPYSVLQKMKDIQRIG